MGAWIETNPLLPFFLRERVAPHVGAWIETLAVVWMLLALTVAPHVGAWIETRYMQGAYLETSSRPTWARGLKHA